MGGKKESDRDRIREVLPSVDPNDVVDHLQLVFLVVKAPPKKHRI